MENAEIIAPENEIVERNYIDNENYVEEEDDDINSNDSDSDTISLIVLLPDENGEPPLRVTEVPYDYDGESFGVSKDGDMPQDFVSDEEVEDVLGSLEKVKVSNKRIKVKGRYTKRKSKISIRLRSKCRNRSLTPRMRSRSPRKRLTLTPSKTLGA